MNRLLDTLSHFFAFRTSRRRYGTFAAFGVPLLAGLFRMIQNRRHARYARLAQGSAPISRPSPSWR